MRSAHLMMIATAVASLVWTEGAHAQNGLSTAWQNMAWPQWQGRLALGLTQAYGGAAGIDGPSATPQLSSLSLLGDYYFYRSYSPGNSARASMGGFRATSGVLLGSASPRLLSAWGGGLSSSPSRFSLSRQTLGMDTAGMGGTKDDDATPYIGLGYTSISLGGGWGFSADIGLSSTLNGRSNSPWGSAAGPSGTRANFEDALREMRLAPLLHLGVSYSF